MKSYASEKTVTIKVQDNNGKPFEITIIVVADQWMDNEYVALDFIETTQQYTEGLTFKKKEKTE